MNSKIYLRLFDAYVKAHPFKLVFLNAESVYNENAKGRPLRGLGISYDPEYQDRYSPISYLLHSSTAKTFGGITIKNLEEMLDGWVKTLVNFEAFLKKKEEEESVKEENISTLREGFYLGTDPTFKPSVKDYYHYETNHSSSTWTTIAHLDHVSDALKSAFENYVDTELKE